MKSDRKKRILAAILCMVMVLSGNISALAEGEVYADPDAVTQMETPEAVSETQPESAPQEPAAEEPPVSTEPAAPEAPAENNEPAAPETPAGNNEPAAPETPAENNEPATPETPETPAEEAPVFSEETELTKELRDASGKLVQKVTAKLPKGAFEAETSQIEMEVTYVDSSMENYIKGMMEKKLPTDNTLGDYFLYNIQFKVNGEAKESLEPITITFEKSNLEIKDTKKANVFFFDPANPEVSGDKDELVEITQRSELLESLQAAGQSTATMEEDYDLSSIEIKEENRSGKIVLEGRKSTIYGCYVEKEPEEKPEQTEEKPVITRYDYKSEDVNVLVTLTDPADLPDNAELSVTPVTISKTAEEQIEEEAIKEKKAIENIVAYDIKFLVDGQEIQPGATVNVQVSLPTIEAGQDAAVYHVDENDAVENMDSSVNEEGNVTFDTSHFSVYVIVQQGENEVTVTIEHYDNRDSQNPVKIYQEDVRTLPVGGKINNYAKAVNWDVAKVVEVAEDGKETAVNTDTEVQVSSDKKFRVYYTPKKTTTEGAVSFYDYTVRAGSITTDQKTTNYSINMPAYYENGAISQAKLSAGGAESSQVNYTYNYPEYQYTNILIKDGSGNLREANKYLGWGVNQPNQMLKNMVKGLDSKGNVIFNYAQPGFFNDLDLTFDLNGITRYLRKVYKDYKLEFNQIGDTYQLSKVYNGSGISVASAGSNFWPLDGVCPNYDGYADTNNLPNRRTNPYFGMRYDVTFKIGDYIGPLNYSFTGDDDFWVILDGSKVVIDLGGIHNACTDSVDLWEYLLNKGQKVGELTTEQKEQEHTLTILYMERGAGEANCNMNFTLPSAQISEVTKVPMADLVLKKANKAGKALEGARFTLLDSNGSTVEISTSTEDGTVKFSKLREGTYTLREDAAPTGYIPSVDTWIVKVEVNGEDTAVATMYLSDGETEYTNMSGSVYQILNVTKQELIDSSMNYNKTAHVKDWDKRTYDINITASSKLTSSTSVENNAKIKDVIDPRFVILDDFGLPITEEHSGIENGVTLKNGGKVTYVKDENGNKYQQIVWTGQTIPYNKDGNQWNQTFTVAAKEEYIGGNNVTTNISPDSSITTSYGDAVLPQPTVNVKSDLIVNDKEVTIYYGDKVPTENEILKALFNKEKPTGNITTTNGKNKTVTYTMGANGKPIDSEDFIMKWYQDEQCTQEITLDEMKDTMPEPVEQKYYLKVSYDALGNSTDMSEANTDKYISNGEAHFETDTERECGIYTINVIKGQIQITKTLDKAASKDETFTFLVHKMEEENETPIAEINITVPQGATTASYVFEQDGNNTDPLQKLKRGTYIVREKEHDSFAVQKVVIGEETDCYSDSEPETARFVLGNNKENKDVISDTYTYAKDGVLGVAHFTNESIIKNWQIVKRSSSDKNLVLPGAEFKLTPDEKNTVPKTYIGISREKGIVKWYETNENGEKLDTEVTQFEPGTYVFSETKAPSGYQKSEETWTIKLSSKGLIRLEGVKEDNVKIKVVDNKTIYKYYFENTPIYSLPSTGGSGIFVYTIGGTLLLMAAALLIYKMKREEVLKG